MKLNLLMQCKDCCHISEDTCFKEKFLIIGHTKHHSLYEVRYACPLCKSFNVSQAKTQSSPVLVLV